MTILREESVGSDEMISFTITKPSLKRSIVIHEEAKKKQKLQELQQNPKIDDQLEKEIRCKICFEIMHQPISLYPCLHNFCGGCFSEWYNKDHKECPSCRTKPSETKKNHWINSIIELFLKSHPEKNRPQTELKELEKANKFNVDRMKLETEELKSDGSASSDEEYLPRPRARNQNLCRQCSQRIDGFQCGQDTQHTKCVKCNQFMPIRDNQNCEVCNRPYCNLYWRTGRKCRNGVETVGNYINTWASIPQNAINKNGFERNLLESYLQSKNIPMTRLADDLVGSAEDNQWELNLGKLYLVGKKMRINRRTLVCQECSGAVWSELLYRFRQMIGGELPENIKRRPDCWYGRECRTQVHKLSHAQKYNHVCEPVTLT